MTLRGLVAIVTGAGRGLGRAIASEEEIVETLLHLAPYAGFPATWEALTIARKVFDER